jgi:hypothetical protein
MLTPDSTSTPVTSLQRGHWYKCGLNIKPLGEMACIVKFILNIHINRKHAIAQLFEAMCHKSESRGFDC